MVNEHRDVIGFVKAFDGSILYLPIELPQQVISYILQHLDKQRICVNTQLKSSKKQLN